MTREIAQTSDYRDFIRSLKQRVQSAQIKAARAVNSKVKIILNVAYNRRKRKA